MLLLPIKFNLIGTFGFVLQKYIKKQQSERSKKLKEDKLLKERAVRERQQKLEVLYMCIVLKWQVGNVYNNKSGQTCGDTFFFTVHLEQHCIEWGGRREKLPLLLDHSPLSSQMQGKPIFSLNFY